MTIDPKSLPGIVVDDADAESVGHWNQTTSAELTRVGRTYLHDGNTGKGKASMNYTPELPRDGRYEVVVLFPPHGNRAANVPVTLLVAGEKLKAVRINQKENGNASLGVFALPSGRKSSVIISNADTDGYVVADAVQFVPQE